MKRRRGWTLALALAATSLAGRASAHGASLDAGGRDAIAVPTWLFLMTGGAAVGGSFLLASFVTDRSFIAALHDWRRGFSVPGRGLLRGTVSLAGLAGLVAVVTVGLFGPQEPAENAGYLLVWVGWWAGFTMSTYLVGNTWPALNPWRTITRLFPTLDRDYPDRLGAWPAVVGLLVLVWLEIVGPPTALESALSQPAFIAALAVAYSVVTLTGAVVFGTVWFERADPVSHVFRLYGRVAPISFDDGGVSVRLPGTALSEPRIVDGPDEVAFVIALLWATTFDGFVATPAWGRLVQPLGVSGDSARVVYLVAMVVGFALFWLAYRLAVSASRELSEAHVTRTSLACQFTPPLLAIAAGYHLAHYLGYFLNLSPALVESFVEPFSSTGTVLTLQLPDWFGGVGIGTILLGHLLAIWVAHASAYDRFPSRLQAVRSQYSFIVVMVLYTMISLWVVSRPVVEPPFL